MKVSIIVTSCNNAHNLKECLNRLLSQTYDTNFINLEIILIDSGSTDGSLTILDSFRDRIRVFLNAPSHKRLSPAENRNIGAGHARGEILIFTDSDCLPPPDWVKKIINIFKNKEIDCITGSRIDIGKGFGIFVRRYDFILYSNKFTILKSLVINKKTLKEGAPLILLTGNNFAIKKEAWDEIGGMRTDFGHPAGEDIMMEIALLKNGRTILFDPHIKIAHFHPISFTRMFIKSLHQGEATYLLTKYSEGFINWRRFAERGHIFNLEVLPLNILIGGALFVIIGFLPLSLIVKFFLALAFLLATLAAGAIRLSKKLESILKAKNKKETKTYHLSFFKLYCLCTMLFCLKITNFFGFLYYSFSKK